MTKIAALSIIPYKFLPPKLGGQKNIYLFFKFFSSFVPTTCVSVIDNDTAAAKEFEVLNLIQNGIIRYINPIYFFKIKKIIKEKQITHLLIEHPYYGWLGILLKIFCNVKLVVRSQNIEAERFKSIGKWWWPILWQYEKTVHRFADFNFFIQGNDRSYGIANFKLVPEKCFVVTYGLEFAASPSSEDRLAAKKNISSLHGITINEKILLFNGSLNYKPNKDALDAILEHINPLLQQEKGFKYKIIVCGNNLDLSYNNLKSYEDKNIIYAGFVEDINLYYKGADMLVNPVIDGGGIKTKLVEALGHNMNVVSTDSGAIGVPMSITGEKMILIEDEKWELFAAAILNSKVQSDIPNSFFDYFYWGKIAENAANILKSN